MNIFENVLKALEPREIKTLGSELSLGKSVGMAIAALPQEKRAYIRQMITELAKEMPFTLIGNALIAFAEALHNSATQIDVVWSGPTPSDFMGRTTWVVAEDLISKAREFIYSATYSAGKESPYIQNLKKALSRGIRVVCLVDPNKLPEVASMVKNELKGAEILALPVRPGIDTPLMHSKFLVIDGFHTFLTSANFSLKAAKSSMETGLWVRNAGLSIQIKDHIDNLRDSGELIRY